MQDKELFIDYNLIREKDRQDAQFFSLIYST